jgi:hypothetical protein
MTWDQLLIVICGPTAIALSQARERRVARWACIVGLVAQPAWFWATWSAGQWGMFAVSFLYAAAWLVGIRNHWLAR